MKNDLTFDSRTDASDCDTDQPSRKMRQSHWLLHSRPLPNWRRFNLDKTTSESHLRHGLELGEHWLDRSAVISSFISWRSMGDPTIETPVATRASADISIPTTIVFR